MKLSVSLLLVSLGYALAATTEPNESKGLDREARRQQIRSLQTSAADGGDNGADNGSGADGSDNGADGRPGTCFSGQNVVDVKGVGMVTMDQLRIGDWVRTSSSNDYSRVYTFSHIDRDAEVEYLQLYTTTDVKEQPIEISADHMIFKEHGVAVKALDIQVGDVLQNQQQVTQIEMVKRRGLYAPVTETGDIVVNNGVLASCYVAILDDSNLIHQHAVGHAMSAIPRLTCGIMPSLCETFDKDGFNMFIAPLYRAVRMLNKQNGFVKTGVILAAIPAIYAIYGMEQLFFSSGLILSALLVGLGYKLWMHNQQNNIAMKIKSL